MRVNMADGEAHGILTWFLRGGWLRILLCLAVILPTIHSLTTRKQRLLARVYVQATIGRMFLHLGRCMRRRILPHSRSLFPVLDASDVPNAVEAQWLTRMLRRAGSLSTAEAVERVDVEELTGNRGLASIVNRVIVNFTDGKRCSYILKMTNDTSLKATMNNILAGKIREAVIYNDLGPRRWLPRVFADYTSQLSGSCLLLMEDIKSPGNSGDAAPAVVGMNMLFGNQVWGVPANIPEIPQKDVLKEAWFIAAEIHSTHWQDTALLQRHWLKGADWYVGRGQAEWELGVHNAKIAWLSYKSSNAFNEVAWSARLTRILDDTVANSTWSDFQEHIRRPEHTFTMLHGDFHAANMLWRCNEDRPVVLLDWADVSVGEATMDLGQMIICDVKPDVRKQHEDSVLRAYYERLTTLGVDSTRWPFDACKRQYARAGVEKCLWLLSMLGKWRLPAKLIQYLHDQILAFIEDHPVPGDQYRFRSVVVMA